VFASLVALSTSTFVFWHINELMIVVADLKNNNLSVFLCSE